MPPVRAPVLRVKLQRQERIRLGPVTEAGLRSGPEETVERVWTLVVLVDAGYGPPAAISLAPEAAHSAPDHKLSHARPLSAAGLELKSPSWL